MLLHVLASQFLVQCCCICLFQKWFCDDTVPFTDIKNPWYASSHSFTKALFFVWPMKPPATFLDRSTPLSCQVQQHWRNLQMFLQQTFIPWPLYICWGVLLEFFASFQDKESKYRWQETGLVSWIACKWSFQFSSLSADIKFFSIFTNFNNVSRYRTIPDTATDLSLSSL